MSLVQVIGAALVVVGVGEYFVFGYLAPRKPNIARRRALLNVNAAFNVVLGLVLVLVGR